jgi:nucleoside-diphosphate-sugar epimerase
MRVIESGEHLGIYNIGTSDERSIADVAREVAEILGVSIQVQSGPAAAGGTPRRCPDISKVRRLGFEPHTPFEQGLKETVNWYETAWNAGEGRRNPNEHAA